MAKPADTIGPELSREALRLKDQTLLEGAMATSALIACADGRVALEEDLTVATGVENAERLQIHDPELALSLHSAYVESLRGDFESGKRRALESVARCAGDIEAAELIVRIGIAVAKADSVFTPEEVAMVREICAHLGVAGLDPLALAGMKSQPRPN